MQLSRAYFECPAAKLLLIFIGSDILVQAICSSCIVGGSITGSGIPTTVISTWPSTSVFGIGGTGSIPLLLTVLCIKFQDTNSMSLPSQKLNKLQLKKGSVKKERLKPLKQGKKRRKKGSKKNKKGRKKRKFLRSSIDDEYGKSKQPRFPSITSRFGSGTASTATHKGKQVRPALLALQQSLASKERAKNMDQDKRKSDRLGGHTNEHFPGSRLSLKDILLNENEEEALREKILAKIDELDPLMCLPKVLCGYSNRQRQKKYSSLYLATTTTTPSSILAGGSIDEYLQLLKIVGPPKKKKEKPAEKDVAADVEDEKHAGKQKVNESEEGDEAQSDEEESDEDKKSESDESTEQESKLSKKKRKKHIKNEVNDDASDSEEEESDEEKSEEESDELLSDEHVKDVIKREKMKKLMWKSSEGSDENWWDGFDLEGKVPYPQLGPTYDPLRNDVSEENHGTIGGWFSNMVTRFMPRMSWLSDSKQDDDFKGDPFFTSFDGRSMKNGEGRSLGGDGWKLPNLFNSSRRAFGRGIDLEKLFGLDGRQDTITGKDPAEKFRMAVELGRKLSSPGQCDYVYNACPLSYEEILTIINEPLSQALTTPVTTFQPFTRNMSYAQNFVTVTTPQIFIPAPAATFSFQQQLLPQQPQLVQYTHQQQYIPSQYQNQQIQEIKQFSPIDDIMAQVAKKKPHKTTIQQELPSGEQMEINLLYANDKGKSGLNKLKNKTINAYEEASDSGAVEEEDTVPPAQNQHKQSFNHKVLPFTNYNFFPSDRYTVRRKNGAETEKPKSKKGHPKSKDVITISTTGGGSSSSSNSGSTEELNPSTPEKSIVSDILMKRQRPSGIPFTIAKGKYAYKQMLKGTSPPYSVNNSEKPRRKKKKKNTKKNKPNKYPSDGSQEYEKRKKTKIRHHQDDTSAVKRRKNSGAHFQQLHYPQHPHQQLQKRWNKDMVENKKKSGKHKPHLHKQSSESIEAKNRLRIRAPNAIYPVYGHPFPSPYGNYYHPPTPTSPSFISYIFGR